MKVAIATDHAGFDLKEKLKSYVSDLGHDVIDTGDTAYNPDDDYPDFAEIAAKKVAAGEVDRAIVICDSGIGVDIVANKISGVRSALVHDEELAKRTREHNDTNVLALGAMFLDDEKAKNIVRNWLNSPFSGAERHQRRIDKISEIERKR